MGICEKSAKYNEMAESEIQTAKDYFILSKNEKSDSKRCRKCGEIYQILNFVLRQGDYKTVPEWVIYGRSGIKEPKEGIETSVIKRCLVSYQSWDLDDDENSDNSGNYEIFHCISIYDDKAQEEIRNGNCIMKDCDGKLDYINLTKSKIKSKNDN